MGKIFVFDIDDTLIIHSPGATDYYKQDKKNTILRDLIRGTGANRNYIYTNGTYSHGENVVRALNLTKDMKKIYARDTIPFMKPLIGSFTFVNNEILQHNYQLMNVTYFFDDMIENLKTAKNVGWRTIWISPSYSLHTDYPDIIDYAFPNIYQALLHFNQKKYY